MCGIVGFKVSGEQERYEAEIVSATDLLAHRGPDNRSLWMQNGVGLGHTRLSILNLSSDGNQPMISYNGRYVICFNGQVYNYIEIASQLSNKIDASSDTRVILEAIAEFGVEHAVRLFNGMFAFAVWDLHEQKLCLVRDAIGIKPLYWSTTAEGYIFASEIKSLRAFKGFNIEVNPQALQEYFTHMYIPAPLSIYNNCFKLLPGHIMTIGVNGYTVHKFTARANNYEGIKDLNEAEIILNDLLDKSIMQHSRSDVPFSAFLSGGVDSSLIVSLLSKSNTIQTYSVGYAESAFDESSRARKIAEYLGVQNTSIILNPSDVKSSIDNIADMYDEPFADASCLPTYAISQEVAKHTKIAFSGDGADELFAGYPRYFNALAQWNRIAFMPYWIRKVLAKHVIPNNSTIFNNLSRIILRDPQSSIPYIKKAFQHRNLWSLFCADNYLGLPRSAFSLDFTMYNSENNDGELSVTANSLRSLLSQDQSTRLPDGMLTKVDRASMRSSLEVRVPFLDNEVVAFSRALPDNFLGQNNVQKLLLKRILSKHLPEELFAMPKTGFHIPMKLWLRTHYKEWAEERLFSAGLCSQNIFDFIQIRRLWNEYCSGNDSLFYPLWSAIMYSQWQQKFKV